MTAGAPRSNRFPKSARLLKSRDFKFRPYRRLQVGSFVFYFSTRGKGRLGISISRKSLRRAAARNRVRRLLRESFRLRLGDFASLDLHVVGLPELAETWSNLKRRDVELVFERLLEQVEKMP